MFKSSSQIAMELSGIIDGDVFGDILHRAAYSTDASIYRIVPACVVAPRDAADITAVIKYAIENIIPVSARGAGSGLAGESLCSGIILDMTRYLNRIISTPDDGRTVICEPGVVLDELNKYLAGFGRKIGPDPSSSNRATVGACLANNATGAHSLLYGHFGDHVESIETVLSDASTAGFKNDFDPYSSPGNNSSRISKECLSLLADRQQIINSAQPKTPRNRCGYTIAGICRDGRIDSARLLSGSEGTLAFFTRLKLRSVPLPAAKALLQLEFASLEQMAQALPAIVESGASTCELMDQTLMNIIHDSLPQYSDILPKDAAAALLVEHTGDTLEQVKEKINKTDSAVGRLAGGRRTFFNASEQARVWKLRKDAGPLLYRKRSKKHPAEFMEDACVDFHQLGQYIAGLQNIGKRYDFTMSFFGHAGDGELHIRPYLDLSRPDERKKMLAIAEDVFTLAWSLGGSISGEHAVGLSKVQFVSRQYGPQYYQLLCGIKNIFDPQGLLNPGKIINSDPDIMLKNLRREKNVLEERIQNDLHFNKDELEIEIEQCNGCGQCLNRQTDLRMCPVYKTIGEELASPRAKSNLFNFFATGQLDESDFESPEFRQFLDLCINCGACRLQCPSGVDVSTLMATARSMYVMRKSLRLTEKVFSNNRYLSMFGSIFAPVSNIAAKLPMFSPILEKATGIDKHISLPRFARGSFIKAARKHLASLPPIKKPIDKVAYFADTFVQYNDHELGFAVIDILRANDIEVYIPTQRPVPLPAVVYGDVKRARKDLLYNAEYLAQAVKDGFKIVCSEPSSALVLKEKLRHFIPDETAKIIGSNTYELMNYLLGLLIEGRLKKPNANSQTPAGKKFVYHQPCHLPAVGDPAATIKVMQELCGISVTDLSAGCCGLAGTFGMQKKNFDLSSKISAGLAEALAKSPVKDILTECSACRMQIERLAGFTVNHPAGIIANYYRHNTALLI
jgi:FAD/FMN-containing dehydrogenase/Fe-S oxidoreductase